MSLNDRKEIYDDIVFDYAAVKTNVFKSKYEESSYWKALDNIKGISVLDLACGSGYYTRQFKEKHATEVIGVDVSGEMITDAEKYESENPLGIKYHTHDASNYVHGHPFDLVTAQYLFCYAETEQTLSTFCSTAYQNTKPGGRFVTVTTVLDETCKMEDMEYGYRFVPCKQWVDTNEAKDGIKANITLYSGDLKSQCTFPNFLWKPKTISTLLYDLGFASVSVIHILDSVPVMIFVAIKNIE